MDKKLKLGIIGLGTVGQGVVKVLSSFDDIEIVGVAVKNLSKKRDVEIKCLTDNPFDLANNVDIDVIVEVAGGLGVYDVLKTAIKNKKHIVTANKELLARHGSELFDLARENRVIIMYEAAVAGGIPIIYPIKSSLSANSFSSVAGILNGTTNYILTKMEEDNLSYHDCLLKAQELGYAETDPTGDVEGYDAMYKIAILSNIAFNKRIDIDKIYREGISNISSLDMKLADEFGYKIKLIALSKKMNDLSGNECLDIRVHPMLVSKNKSLADIKNATNAVMLDGFPVGEVMFVGAGAGEFPTASSVVGDILTIKSELNSNGEILPMTVCHHSDYANQINIEDTINCYYLRIKAANTPGTIGKIGLACGKYNINLSCILQKGVNDDRSATIIVITEECYEKDINLMIKDVEQTSEVKVLNRIRVM